MTSEKRPPVWWARQYAAYGYRVFPAVVFRGEDGKWVKAPVSKKRGLVLPCPAHPGGKPVVQVKNCHQCQGGHNAATLDPDTITRYWSDGRTNSHVGILPPEGVVIIDDDSHVFDLLWLDGPHVRTASGKAHFYFRLANGQDELASTNQIVYSPPDGRVDIRVGDGRRYALAPCGTKHYRRVNGWTPDPARLPLLPAWAYERLLEAPRVANGGGVVGPGDERFSPGVPELDTNAYDFDAVEAEELLLEAGWEPDGSRWTRPGGSGTSAVFSEGSDGVWRLSVFTTSDELLHGGHFYTPSMLRCALDHGGDWNRTYDAIISETFDVLVDQNFGELNG